MARAKGVNYYRSLLGAKLQHEYNDEVILKELNNLKLKLNRFPKQKEIGKRLSSAIFRRGGVVKFKIMCEAVSTPVSSNLPK